MKTTEQILEDINSTIIEFNRKWHNLPRPHYDEKCIEYYTTLGAIEILEMLKKFIEADDEK